MFAEVSAKEATNIEYTMTKLITAMIQHTLNNSAKDVKLISRKRSIDSLQNDNSIKS